MGRELLRSFERAADSLAAGESPRDVFERIRPVLLRASRESNRLSRAMELDDCVTPLPLGGAAPA